jgi:hypothetical protein
MTSELIRFPVEKTNKYKQDQIEASLAEDPNYHFIRDLLQAVAGVGLELDKPAEAKARELYAQCQRENLFAKWIAETE